MVWVFPGIFPAIVMVAPNSPRLRAKESTIPPIIPGIERGMLTRKKVEIFEAPNVREAFSYAGSINSKEDRIVLTAGR